MGADEGAGEVQGRQGGEGEGGRGHKGKGKGGSTLVVVSAAAEANWGGTWQQNWSNQRSTGKLINFFSPLYFLESLNGLI
jgi:hypothetical protein